MTDFHGRHFLKELDFTPAEWLELLELAAELKAAKKEGREVQYLKNKNIALIFERLRPVPAALLKLLPTIRALT